jgi:hypothetical protein
LKGSESFLIFGRFLGKKALGNVLGKLQPPGKEENRAL